MAVWSVEEQSSGVSGGRAGSGDPVSEIGRLLGKQYSQCLCTMGQNCQRGQAVDVEPRIRPPLTESKLEMGHMATHGCKGGWKCDP
ncbi:hexokinase-1 isoform HK1-sb [Cricetulus griseus]|nr:hexokinase-1 isoform HK1-sb [Cricetulus griseus]